MGMCNSKDANPKTRTYLTESCTGHEGGINCMALSDDSSVLITGSEDRTARLWTTKTEKCECIGILKGHDDYINCVLIEDRFAITCSADKTIRKWDVGSCDCVLILVGHKSLVNRIICNGDYIFSSSYDRTARCWDLDTGECIRVFAGHKRGVYPMIFIPGDDDDPTPESASEAGKDILLTGSADFTAKCFSFETGKCLLTFRKHQGAVTCMSTDVLGKTLFTGSADNTIISWDIAKGEEIRIFSGHHGSIICLQVVNKIMYSGSSDGTVRSWATEFGDCTRVINKHKHTIIAMKVHEGMLYTGAGDAMAMCFDPKSGALRREFPGHENAVNCLQVVEKRLFTGSHDKTLKIWDVSNIKGDELFQRDDNALVKEKMKSTEMDKFSGGNLDGNRNGIDADAKITIDDGDFMKSSDKTDHLIVATQFR